jgi:hypothetical protein
MKSAVDKAIDAAGGACRLAEVLGVKHQAVYFWQKRGWVPLARAGQIEKKYGVPRRKLMDPRIVSAMG